MEFNIMKRMFCFIVFLRTLIDVLSQSPQNAIAVVNGQAKFNCSVGASFQTNWVQNSDPGDVSGQTIIASGCKIESSFTTNYAAENGSNFCNLIISNVNMQLAGIYSCINAYVPASSYTAILTVIDQNANVAVLSSTALAEDESINISCSLTYNTSVTKFPRLIPTLSWKVPIGQNATAVFSDTQTNTVTSFITVMIQRPNLPIFQCTVNFTLTGNLFNRYATNIPTSPVTSWNTPMIYDVLYPARTCSITSEKFLNSGNCNLNLSCVASANPPAKYRWVAVTDTQPQNSLNDKQFFAFPEDGRTYQCTAYYVIKGKEQNTSCIFTVPNQRQPCDEPATNIDFLTTPQDLHNMSTSVPITIVVLVGWVAINLIVMALFLLYYNSNQQHKNVLNARFQCLITMLSCHNDKPVNFGWIFLFGLMSIITGVIVFPILLVSAISRFQQNKYKATSGTTQNIPATDLQNFGSSTGGENEQKLSNPSEIPKTTSKTDPYDPICTGANKNSSDLSQINQNDLSLPLTKTLEGKGSPKREQLPESSPYKVVGTEYQNIRSE